MIKINFCDFWPGFEANNLFLRFLKQHFPVFIDDKPDYLFYSVYGKRHLEYDNCIKILYTGENLVPDFNLCDYAIGFHYLDFGDRYMRFPLYAYYQWHYDSVFLDQSMQLSITNEYASLADRKFCNFVYSNNVNADPIRDVFFHKLCKYKKVDAGGRHLNNIGGAVKDKLQFIKDYKFTIAFENSAVPGYTTEKLIEPILVKSLPIYFGNPLLYLDFEPDSLVLVESRDDLDQVIDQIMNLDKNDDQYLAILKKNKFRSDNTLAIWEKKLKGFLENIFEQSFPSALRRASYGFNSYYTEEIQLQAKLLLKKKGIDSRKARIKKILLR